MDDPGTIVILNGAPRSGKTAIVRAVQDAFDGPWVNLGVDAWALATPPRYWPGIGLRPGGERPDLEEMVATLYAALYDSVAALSRRGLNVVVDVGHHDSYSAPLGVLARTARQLEGLPALLVGVRCPIEVIMQRRDSDAATGAGYYAGSNADGSIPEAVLRWQHEVHVPGVYDLEVDTSTMTPAQGAELIRERLRDGPPPSALARLASAG